MVGSSREQHGMFEQDWQTIEKLICQWRADHPGVNFAIAIEATKDAIINSLLSFDDVIIYPINPAALASYRNAFKHGGGKNDPADAILLCQYLEHYIDQLRPLRQDDPITREIAARVEDRRRLVDQRTAHCNELKAVLKQYFPEILKIGAAKIYAAFLIRFLLKYSTLHSAQKAGATRLRKFFFGCRAKTKVEDRVSLLTSASPLSDDEVLLRSCSCRVIAICKLIETYNQQVRQYDTEIKLLVRKHAATKSSHRCQEHRTRLMGA